MSPTVKNSLKSAAVLTAVAVAAALLLALANAFLKVEYIPELNQKTVSVLNGLVSSGGEGDVDAATALSEGHFDFAWTAEEVAAWNQKNASGTRKVTAVYKAVKGKGAGQGIVFVETETAGYVAKAVLITAIKTDGTLVGMGVLSIPEAEYYSGDIEGINRFIAGKKAVSVAELKPYVYTAASARVTTTAFTNAISLASKICGEVEP